MPRTQNSTKNGDKAAAQAEAVAKEEELQAEEKSRAGTGGVNPYMQRLTPEMLSNPYPLDIGRGRTMKSSDFALAKLDNLIARPLGLDTEAQWLAFARMLFAYRQRVEEQRVEEQVNKLFEDSKQNPAILQRLAQRINAVLASQQQEPLSSLPPVFSGQEEHLTPLDIARYS